MTIQRVSGFIGDHEATLQQTDTTQQSTYDRERDRYPLPKSSKCVTIIRDWRRRDEGSRRAEQEGAVVSIFSRSYPRCERFFNANRELRRLCNEQDEAILTLFVSMKQDGPLPDLESYKTLIRYHCRKKEFHAARTLFNEMVAEKIPPDEVATVVIIQSLCDANEMDQAWEFYEEFKQSQFPLEAANRTLIKAFCQNWNIDRALFVFQNMKTKENELYTTLINILCKAKRVKSATTLFQEMKMNNFVPSTPTYNMLIESYFEADDEEAACLCYKEMESPNLETYNIIIRCFCRRENKDKAEIIFKQIAQHGLEPDEDSYYPFVVYTCLHQGPQAAIDQMNDLGSQGIVISPETHERFITLLSSRGVAVIKKTPLEIGDFTD